MRSWEAVAMSIGQIAPLLGTTLKGEVGFSIIAGALGVKNEPEAILEALDNPESTDKILRLQELLKELSITPIERQRNSVVPSILVVALTIVVTVGCISLFIMPIPKENEASLYLLLGSILAKWGDTLSYWVGSTYSSEEQS